MKLKKVIAAAAAAMMVASVATPAFAAGDVTTTDAVIDTSLKGTITLHKLLENDGRTVNANGLVNPDETRQPVEGVVFSLMKVADIMEVSDRVTYYNPAPNDTRPSQIGKDVVGVYYTNLDTHFIDTINSILGNTIDTDSDHKWDKRVEFAGTPGQAYYTTEQMEYYLDLANDSVGDGTGQTATWTGETKLLDALSTYGTALNATDSTGTTSSKTTQATSTGLDLGLYIVGETDIRARDGLKADGTPYLDANGYPIAPNPEEPVIESPASPFYVCLPTTNIDVVDGKQAGTVWMYDLNVYPKDSRNEIFKRIIDPDQASTENRKLRTREDYQIGDKIEQVIYADAPKLQSYVQDGQRYAKTHKKFVISDKMSDGLTVDRVTEVAISNKVPTAQIKTDKDLSEAAGYTVLQKDTDYQIAGMGTQEFSVTFTPAGLQKLDNVTCDSQVVVWFDSTLNGVAKIGEDKENINAPKLTWRNSNTLEREYQGNVVRVYSYGLDMQKEGLTNATKATFKVQRHDTIGAHTDDFVDVGFQAEGQMSENTTNVKFIELEAGKYRVFDENGTGHIDNGKTPVTELHPAANGTLKVYGLDSNRYTFLETSTEGPTSVEATDRPNQGKDLLKTTFDVRLEAADPGNSDCDRYGIFTPDRDGKLLPDKTTASVTNRDDPQHPVVSSTHLQMTQGNAGIANLIVNNYKTITLRTGGAGRMALYLFGFSMIAVLSGIVIFRKRRAA